MKEGPYMPKDKIKDIFFIGGFASIFHFLGCLMVLIFSIRTTLECDRSQDVCSLSSEYVLRSSDQQKWLLSDMKRAYVEMQHPIEKRDEKEFKTPTYRAVIVLSNRSVPFHSSYSTNREKIQKLVDDLESFITGNTSNVKDTETFIYSEYTLGFVIAIGGGLNLAGFAILYWFLWPILKRES